MFTNTAISARLAGDDTGETSIRRGRLPFGAGSCARNPVATKAPKASADSRCARRQSRRDREPRGVRRTDAWNRQPRGFAGRQRSRRSRRHQGQARSRRDRACRGSAVRASKTGPYRWWNRSEEHTSELQSQSNLVCRLLLEKKKNPQAGHGGQPYARYRALSILSFLITKKTLRRSPQTVFFSSATALASVNSPALR